MPLILGTQNAKLYSKILHTYIHLPIVLWLWQVYFLLSFLMIQNF